MTDITKNAFLKAIWPLRPYLTDIVVGGGWAPLIYYHYLLGDKTKNPVRTFDIDLMVKTKIAVRGDKNIAELLSKSGLTATFKSTIPFSKPELITIFKDVINDADESIHGYLVRSKK